MERLRPLMICLLAALFLTGGREAVAAEAYSGVKLQSFASAGMAVNAVVEPSEADKQKMAEQANQEARAAVDGTEGITVDEYQAIARLAQGDAALMARIDQVLQDTAP